MEYLLFECNPVYKWERGVNVIEIFYYISVNLCLSPVSCIVGTLDVNSCLVW